MGRALLTCCFLSLCFFSLQGDEGMWPFSRIPKEKIYQEYGVKITDEWLNHVQKASLRVSAGGSASFISAKGLVMTNHHVGVAAIYNLSTESQDYLENGFYAKNLDEELACQNFYVDQLIAISDVTEEVNKNILEGMSFAERENSRKETIAIIQQEAEKKTGLQPEIVMLYHGAKYHLYLYKRYTDLRLVMAPERSIAFLGGDIDNFEYPRYNLDMCFFRVYENGKPLETEHYLKWSSEGPQEGEVLFVSGHPGKTKRMYTADHLSYLEKVEVPLILSYLEDKIKMLENFSSKSNENFRIALQQKHSLANAYKVYKGIKKGYIENSPIPKKEKEDSLLYGSKESDLYVPWRRLKEALLQSESYIASYFLLEGFCSNYSKVYGIAKSLVRLSEEKNLPNEKRMPGYIDTEIEKLELKILSSEPIYAELEVACLVDSIRRMEMILGKTHPLVVAILQEKSPEEVAENLIQTTNLKDLKERERLYHHLDEIKSSEDPLIVFAKSIDVYARELHKLKEESLDSIQNECYALIAEQSFNRYGLSVYPDATFTLRLSYGCMKGYKENGRDLNPMTTIKGLFKHVENHQFLPPYQLPDRWMSSKKDLNKKAPVNFVSTNDIIGGNSGSPVLNVKGEWVGLIFDGNEHSITWGQMFDEKEGRAISVHSQGIIEALQSVYHASNLVAEIQGI